MDTVRRLNPASSSEAGPSTPRIRTPGGPATPTSHPETPFDPETPWVGHPEEPSLKWFNRYQRPGKKAHPYNLAAISVQTKGPVKKQSSHCQFWPFVGPYKPKKKVKDVNFDDWENMVAIAATNMLVVGRCSDEREKEPWVVLWDLQFTKDQLFQVAWTFDLFTYHPLIVVAGQLGLIYVIDAVTKACIKTFKGHGSEVLGLSICQSHPHILASASGDKTIRIWNICGSTQVPPPPPGTKLSENYPMGDADEGNACIAILCGEGSGGHRSKVIGCSFHSKHAAIATCGSDYVVKIWALPPFPKPDPTGPPTPRGYRPTPVYFPVFSTSRIHDNTIDNIQWLGPDLLISRDVQGLVVWQWLGYKRFFHPQQFNAIHVESQRSDFNDSHSFMLITKYPVSKASLSLRWYVLFGLHQAFKPTPAESDLFEKSETLVTSPLIAIPVESRPPEIHLFNPLLAQPDPPPDPITDLRPLSPPLQGERVLEGDPEEEEDDEENTRVEDERDVIAEIVEGESEISDVSGSSNETGDQNMEGETELDLDSDINMSVTIETPSAAATPTRGTPTRLTTTITQSQTGITITEGMSAIERVKLQPRKPKPITLVPESDDSPAPKKKTVMAMSKGKDQENEKDGVKKKKNPSLAPYVLRASAWQSALKLSSVASQSTLEKSVISCCAISPRGAKWIVGVGDVQSVFVFRLAD